MTDISVQTLSTTPPTVRNSRDGFSESSSSPVCLTCGALVPSQPRFLDLHREWHTELAQRVGVGA